MDGWRFERKDNGRPANHPGSPGRFGNQSLMPTMHAVEVADGNRAAPPGFRQLLSPIEKEMRHADSRAPGENWTSQTFTCLLERLSGDA
jgi:hypothetical protein